MSLPKQATRLVLANRPTGPIVADTFKVERVPIASVQPQKPSDVLVAVEYLSIDPAMRGWLDDRRSYIEPVKVGATMRASGIATVVAVGERSSGKFKVGDKVQGTFGWTDYALMDEKELSKIITPPGAKELDFMGPLGSTGLTAYFGLFNIGKLKAGETCVVSGAAGAVGSVACQLAKIKGARVIAIAGSDDKCKWLEDDIGVDKALNYKSASFAEDFKKHVGYLDVYFDNVGGEILDLCLGRLKQNARIALCGAVSEYGKAPKGLKGYMNLISQRATLQGFIVFDYAKQYKAAREEMAKWMSEGKIKSKFHIVEGLEKCPQHLQSLLAGANTGKMVVRVSAQDTCKL